MTKQCDQAAIKADLAAHGDDEDEVPLPEETLAMADRFRGRFIYDVLVEEYGFDPLERVS